MSLKFCQFKPISISLSPNTERDDIRLALKLIFQFWKWKKGTAIKNLEEEFKKYLGIKYAFSFNSGRSAFLSILKSLDLNLENEVLLQAFTCNAAINPVLWANLKPIYVDCDEKTFNIDIDDLRKKITPNSRILIVQHTFGLPVDINEIQKIAKENNLILIEDCAHSLGAEYLPSHQNFGSGGKEKKGGLPTEAQWAKVGTFGKAAFFSFSRDKIISSVYGGMAVTNDENLAEKIRKFQEEINYPSYFWIFQQILHPVLMNSVILPIYNFFDLGKVILVLSQCFHILSKAIHWKEKRGKKPSYFPKKLPNALALLALNQFKKLERFNKHREKIADFYYNQLKNSSFELPPRFSDRKNVFLRFTVKHKNAHQIIWEAWKKQNILVGDWYTTPIAPYNTKLDEIKYKLGSCPTAEKLAKITLNLPTHINISIEDVERVVNFLKKF